MHYKTPITFAHSLWRSHLAPGATVVDATCGNGRDTAYLAELIGPTGTIHAVDLQPEAIANAKERLKTEPVNVHWHCGCHSSFPEGIKKGSADLVVYNLGYLPGGDKQVITVEDTTISSLERASELVPEGGAISITCYPGHPGGENEQNGVVEWASALNKQDWIVVHHQWINRRSGPSLIWCERT